MKTKVFLIQMLGMLMMMTSCADKVEFPEIAGLDEFNKENSGIYICKGIFALEELDLNNDGIANKNLLEEMSGFHNVQIMTHDHAAYALEYINGTNVNCFYLSIPLQVIRDPSDENTISNIITPSIRFDYIIDKEGKVYIENKADYSSVYSLADCKINSHFRDMRDAHIERWSNGRIILNVSISYYDYIRKEIINVPVRLTYGKVR